MIITRNNNNNNNNNNNVGYAETEMKPTIT